VLQWQPVQPLQPKSHEVVIAVEAAGVNNADLVQRRGGYPVPPGAPDILGLECAGHITSVGDDVTDWSVGDEVCALLAGGGYADEVAVPAAHVLPIPTGLSVIEASVVPEAACTVYFNLAMRARLQTGQTALIHGASGGIGTFAIQWAAGIGATVITTAGSEAKSRIGQSLGATTAINYRTDDFVAATLAATDGRGVDMVVDPIGGEAFDDAIRVLATEGRLLVIGFAAGGIPTVKVNRLLLRNVAVIGVGYGEFVNRKPGSQSVFEFGVAELVNAGLRPPPPVRFPLSKGAEALESLADGGVLGKVVLEP